jgi:hypothetical protein
VPPRGGLELLYSHENIQIDLVKCTYIFCYRRTAFSYIYFLQKNLKMATTDLKALRFPFKDPKFIFFTDFDGTITLKDSNDYMVGKSCFNRFQIRQVILTDRNRQTLSATAARSVRRATKMCSRARRPSGKSRLATTENLHSKSVAI